MGDVLKQASSKKEIPNRANYIERVQKRKSFDAELDALNKDLAGVNNDLKNHPYDHFNGNRLNNTRDDLNGRITGVQEAKAAYDAHEKNRLKSAAEIAGANEQPAWDGHAKSECSQIPIIGDKSTYPTEAPNAEEVGTKEKETPTETAKETENPDAQKGAGSPGGDAPERDGKKRRLRNWFAGLPRAGRIIKGAVAGTVAATLVALGINYLLWNSKSSAVPVVPPVKTEKISPDKDTTQTKKNEQALKTSLSLPKSVDREFSVNITKWKDKRIDLSTISGILSSKINELAGKPVLTMESWKTDTVKNAMLEVSQDVAARNNIKNKDLIYPNDTLIYKLSDLETFTKNAFGMKMMEIMVPNSVDSSKLAPILSDTAKAKKDTLASAVKGNEKKEGQKPPFDPTSPIPLEWPALGGALLGAALGAMKKKKEDGAKSDESKTPASGGPKPDGKSEAKPIETPDVTKPAEKPEAKAVETTKAPDDKNGYNPSNPKKYPNLSKIREQAKEQPLEEKPIAEKNVPAADEQQTQPPKRRGLMEYTPPTDTE